MRGSALLAALLAGLAVAGQARAAPIWGVVEDQTKYADDGGRAYFLLMKDLGLTQNRITVLWNPNDPTTIQDKTFLERSLPVAKQLGIDIVFVVYPSVATGISADPRRRIGLFAQYVGKLLRTYPGQVQEVYVGNEVNQPRFWRPQFLAGLPASPALYEQTLAAVYDAVKAVDPSVVVTMSLSPHGNDDPTARSNVSLSPVRFLEGLGEAYRRSGRRARIMDRIAVNLYPYNNQTPPTKPAEWPNISVGTFDRVKQAFWDAFHGTGQPTFAEGPSRSSTGSTQGEVGEYGFDTETEHGDPPCPPGSAPECRPCPPKCYEGSENLKPVSEQLQAQYYAQAIQLLSCDPSIVEANLLHLIDEQDRRGWQSGVLRLDGTRRPSYDAVKAALASISCPALHSWSHTTSVVGAAADFDTRAKRDTARLFTFRATAAENAFALGGVYRVSGPRAKVTAAGLARLQPALTDSKLVEADRNPLFELRGRLQDGYYVFGVTLRAEMNPARMKSFVSGVFKVGR